VNYASTLKKPCKCHSRSVTDLRVERAGARPSRAVVKTALTCGFLLPLWYGFGTASRAGEDFFGNQARPLPANGAFRKTPHGAYFFFAAFVAGFLAGFFATAFLMFCF
jgi:hypothetical protein